MVIHRDALSAQHLLDRHREEGTCLDGCIVGDDHGEAARHPADARHHAGRRRTSPFLVELKRRENAQLEKIPAGINHLCDALAGRETALGMLLFNVAGPAAETQIFLIAGVGSHHLHPLFPIRRNHDTLLLGDYIARGN